jgi:hypothetical protein
MSILKEGNIEINIPNTVSSKKFDDAQHGLSHCMKAVDFIVELTDVYLFIEIKDPVYHLSNEDQKKFNARSFLSDELDENLKYKYRDSFLYEWASKKTVKPIYYLVLIAINTLTEAELITRTEELKRKLPVNGPRSGTWKRNIVNGCSVFNIKTWNKKFPNYSVKRV